MNEGEADRTRKGVWSSLSHIATWGATLILLLCMPVVARAQLPAVGDTVSGNIELAVFNMPLPDGVWEVYYSVEENFENKPIIKLGLLKTKGRVVSQIIYVFARGSVDLRGFRRNPNCERDDYMHSVVRFNRPGLQQDCWQIRAEDLTTGDGASDRLLALIDYAEAMEYRLGLTTVGPRFHMAHRDSMIRTYYGWLPDAILPPSNDRKVWLFADWTPRFVEKDPRKKIVFGTLKGWAEDWYPKYLDMFTSRTLTAEE